MHSLLLKQEKTIREKKKTNRWILHSSQQAPAGSGVADRVKTSSHSRGIRGRLWNTQRHHLKTSSVPAKPSLLGREGKPQSHPTLLTTATRLEGSIPEKIPQPCASTEVAQTRASPTELGNQGSASHNQPPNHPQAATALPAPTNQPCRTAHCWLKPASSPRRTLMVVNARIHVYRGQRH